LGGGKNIHHTILDEGASTYVMYFPFWKSLGFPELTLTPITLKAFDGRGFQPHETLAIFRCDVEG
jgi:hypothetical protein